MGVDPIEFVARFTGSSALITSSRASLSRRCAVITWLELILSSFAACWVSSAFFYALLHFSTYLVLDLFFDFRAIGKDVASSGPASPRVLLHSWPWSRSRSRRPPG